MKNGAGNGCTSCPTGQVFDTPSNSCINCMANSVASPYNGGMGCVRCSAGTSTKGVAGATSCSPCPAGYSSTNASDCTKCPVNQTSTAGGVCTACAVGTYVNSQNVCSPCPAGQVADVVTGICTILCPESTYKYNGTCISCPPGYTSVNGGPCVKYCNNQQTPYKKSDGTYTCLPCDLAQAGRPAVCGQFGTCSDPAAQTVASAFGGTNQSCFFNVPNLPGFPPLFSPTTFSGTSFGTPQVISYTGSAGTLTLSAGTYQFIVKGAAGGGMWSPLYGGKGRTVIAYFTLTSSTSIQYVIGGQGTDFNQNAGGGGGTYVYDTTNSRFLYVAGGGGGQNQYGYATTDAGSTTSPGSGSGGTFTGYSSAGAGGGINGNGASGYGNSGGGKSFTNGSAGGTGYTTGGFGGGGGAQPGGGGGGGGGYTGGNSGLGGTSYAISGSDISYDSADNTGNGSLSILAV